MRRLTTVLLLLTVAALPSAAARADTAPEFFQLPAGSPLQGGIAAASDGSIWVGAGPMSRPGLARLRPALASPGTANGVDTFPTPGLSASCCANMVRSLAADPESGRVWFVQSDGIIGHADPAAVTPGTGNGINATLVRTTLTGGSRGDWSPDLWDVAIGRGGVVWFTERSTTNVAPYPGARIASLTRDLGAPSELSNIALQGGATSLSDTRFDALPSGIAVDADGRPWFAESNPGLPGWRIATPRGGGPDYDEYDVTPCAPVAPCSGSHTGTGVSDVAVAPDGSIWFTNQLRNELGRLDVRVGTFTSYALPAIDPAFVGGSRPIAITTAPDGTLWLAQYGGPSYPAANAIVRIVPDPLAPSATVWRLGRDNNPIAVTADTRGNVWFALATNTAPSLIGRLAGVVGAGPGGGGGGTPGGGTPGGGGPPPVVIRPVSIGAARPGTPSTDGDTMSIDQICLGPPEAKCSVVYIISAGEYVTGFPGARSDDRDRSRAVLAASAGVGPVAAAAAKRGKRRAKGRGRARRARATILGTKTVTLRGGQRTRVKVTLNATGRRLLRRAGRLKLFMTVTERGRDGRGRRVKAVKVTFRRPAARGRARRRR